MATRVSVAIAREERVTPQEVIAAIEELLHQAGASIVEQQLSNEDIGVDLAAWFDSIQRAIGNPLVVEVKRVHSKSDVIRAQTQLTRALNQRHFGAGLLVYYPSIEGLAPESSAHLPISVTLSFDDLLRLVVGGKFLETLISLRNIAAHEKV